MMAISALSWAARSSRLALGVDRQRIPGGLDHLGQQRQLVGAADDLAGPARLDFAVLQRGNDQAQGADPDLVAGFHRVFHLRRHASRKAIVSAMVLLDRRDSPRLDAPGRPRLSTGPCQARHF